MKQALKGLSYIVLVVFVSSCEENVERVPVELTFNNGDPMNENTKGIYTIIEKDCSRYDKEKMQVLQNSCEVRTISKYDKNGVLIEYIVMPDGIFNDDTTGFYRKTDDRGLILEEVRKDPFTGENKKYLNKYNDAGFKIEESKYIDGKLDYRIEKEYDSYNCIIKEKEYNSKNQLESITENEYNNSNLITYKKVYNAQNELKKSVDYTIKRGTKSDDVSKNRIDAITVPGLPWEGYEDVEYYPNKKVKSWHYINNVNRDVYQSYDQLGNIIERRFEDNGKWIETFSYKYREDGALLELKHSTSEVLGKSFYETTTYYKVDFNGNWIEQIKIDNEGNGLDGRIREIEYYPVSF